MSASSDASQQRAPAAQNSVSRVYEVAMKCFLAIRGSTDVECPKTLSALKLAMHINADYAQAYVNNEFSSRVLTFSCHR